MYSSLLLHLINIHSLQFYDFISVMLNQIKSTISEKDIKVSYLREKQEPH